MLDFPQNQRQCRNVKTQKENEKESMEMGLGLEEGTKVEIEKKK